MNKKMANFFSEYGPVCLLLAMFGLIGLLMLHSAHSWPAEFMRSGAGDKHFLRGVVVNLGDIERYDWKYRWSTYDLRRDRPRPPSIAVVRLPDEHLEGVSLKVLPVQLDGANQGYAGMVTRIKENVPYGTRVVCGFGRIYYPTRNRSKFAFWLECKSEADPKPLWPIHQCRVNKYSVLVDCPDDGSKRVYRRMPQWW